MYQYYIQSAFIVLFFITEFIMRNIFIVYKFTVIKKLYLE